jgi:hypothetical protein
MADTIFDPSYTNTLSLNHFPLLWSFEAARSCARKPLLCVSLLGGLRASVQESCVGIIGRSGPRCRGLMGGAPMSKCDLDEQSR